jgi:hypothetical protein
MNSFKRTLLSGMVAAAAFVLVPVGCTDASRSGGASETDINGVPTGQIRGVIDISNTLRTRLFDDSAPTSATFDISRVAGPSMFALRGHLGALVQVGTGTDYQGGTPTAFNVTLWYELMGRFAQDFGALCDTPGPPPAVTFGAYAGVAGPSAVPFRLLPAVAAQITDACTFQGDEGARRQTASALFDSLMGLGGSLAAEKQAFEDEFAANGSSWITASGKDRLAGMFLDLLLNPHFLLAK